MRVGEEVAGTIGPGLLILVGVSLQDDEAAARWLARKCAELRIFDDESGQLNRSLVETGGQALVVSQFTLHGDVRRGRRPSWSRAAPGPQAEPLVEVFCRALEEAGIGVARGRFGAHMEVELVNDGPVTLMVDSPEA